MGVFVRTTIEYQRKQQEKDASPMAQNATASRHPEQSEGSKDSSVTAFPQNDEHKMAQNDKITKLTKITSEIAAHQEAIRKLVAEMRQIAR